MSDEMNVKATLDFDVNQAPRQINQVVTALAKLESSTVKGVGQLSRVEKQAVQAGQAARKLAGEYKNLAAELARVNRENAKLQSTSASPALTLGTKSTNLLPAAQRISQRAAYSSYTSNIAYSQARREEARLIDQTNNKLSNQRYALYDVARTWGLVSTAILGTAGAVAKLGVDYQRNFADVARTTGVAGESAQALKRDLVDLTTAIPEDFAAIAEIAALGGQLDIAASGIEAFTSVTARLTATTNLTAEAAGTALGRFQALLDVKSSEFENLASAILKVGVNSVATESQIVNIATQVSSMGDLAGLSADQVIGLSGALASVGGQPELSRGTITRTFSLMSAAIAEGGEKLEGFAQVAGVSAQEFASAWGTSKFAYVFQSFLANLGTNGDVAISTLRELGITSVRDVPLLLRLAGASKVVGDAFDNAATGYEDATELNKQYAIIAETVAAKLTVLGNTIKAIAEAVSSEAMGPFGTLLDVIQNIATAILTLARTPVGQFFMGTAGAVAVLVGVLLGYQAIQALTTASIYAMITAHKELGAVGTTATGSMRGLTGMLAANAIGLQRATAAQTAYNLAVAQGQGKMAAYIAGTKAAATATNGLATAGKTASKALVWTAVLSVGIGFLTDFLDKSQDAAAAVDEYTASLDQNTAAITGNTRVTAASRLYDEGITQKARGLGISVNQLTDAILGEGDALRSIQGPYDAILARITELNEKSSRGGGLTDAEYTEWKNAQPIAEKYAQILSFLGAETDNLSEAQERQRVISSVLGGTAQETASDLEELTDALQDQVDVAFEGINAEVGMQNALYGLGQSIVENGTAFNTFSAGGRANMEALQKTISAMVTAAAGDSTMLASLLAGLMQQLAGYGVNASQELGMVQSMIAQLSQGKPLYDVKPMLSGFGEGVAAGNEKIAKSAKKAKEEIRTLSDYVRDLEGVFQNAFDFRFGLDNSVDDVADAWQALKDNSDEAAQGIRDALQAIREADAEISGLNAAKTTLEYQLRVAQEYGDTLRANEIIAEMADNQAKLTEAENDRADSQGDLKDAQDSASKSLDGQTEASREQRDLVQSLLKAYIDQIAALANTGASSDQLVQKTAELKRRFIEQLTQLGFNEQAVYRYAASFDDLTYAIANVPRNITLGADVSPAVRAVNEYLASLNSVKGAVDSINSTPISQQVDAAKMNAWTQIVDLEATQQRLRSTMANTPLLDSAMRMSIENQIKTISAQVRQLSAGLFYTGGYTGRGGKYQPAGIVHAGEYVIPKEHVDQRTGLPYANALNSIGAVMHSTSNYYNGGYVSPSDKIQLVELLPNQIRQIVDGLYVRIELDGKEIASSVNKANSGFAVRGNN